MIKNEQHEAATLNHLIFKIPFLAKPLNDIGKTPKTFEKQMNDFETVKTFSMMKVWSFGKL